MSTERDAESDERWLRGIDDEDDGPERRTCNECGEEWVDTGSEECPFCGSTDTEGGS